jgi:hypothetical protein
VLQSITLTRLSVRVAGLVLAVALAVGSTALNVPTLVEPDAAQAQHLRT